MLAAVFAELPSLTALAVSFARALVTLDEGASGEGLDPVARRLLPRPARAALSAVSLGERLSPLTLRSLRALSLGLVDHLELRSLAIDAVARRVLRSSARQLVILGAGLDARAWRLPEAEGARVFEVDHPATQRYKRPRAGAAGADVRFVPVDFERDSLDACLAHAGHDASSPTLWIWEGVTMYLPRDATLATLRVVAGRSAAGSTLAVTYATPELWSLPAALAPYVERAFRLLGEPLRGVMTESELATALADVGFDVVEDSGVDEWGRDHSPERVRRVRIAERLAVAMRRG
jgi:methyltransferase (TIGR00027 family)